ncbi:MAG: FtsX-like permease family protein, partial [Clostridia bacterium]|nr:FtsX-like permease family protein [Clostridia bacterium]
MKKSLWKNNFKEIIKTRRRFISILIMAFLGVGFFSGLIATGPDMRDSLDHYADTNNLFDIDIISTLGLTEKDIESINKIDGIESTYGSKTKDSMAIIEENEGICKVIEYNENSNTPVVIEGRLPENEKECLLDKNYSITTNFSEYIGKTIILENDELNTEDTPIFNEKEFKIVGIAESPIYISGERGNTTIGNGTIDFFIYTNEGVINLDYYTNIYSIVKGTKELNAYSEEYWNLVTPVISNIENIKEVREEARYNYLIEDAQRKLDYAKDEIDKIEKAKWYIRDRKDNTGYTNIMDAIKTMTNIARLFPVIFYLVAVLISLTSMTRMIEEERTEIGTLKALGYTNNQIIIKYILYAFLACVIGGFLGMTVGFSMIPKIVWKIYSTIYQIPKFYATYRLDIGLVGLLIAFVCIGGATILVAVKELKNMPSVLMRPKAPKNGKKIWLEKVSFIWKRFNFSKKVTARNIFRYKKRAIMTVVGIAGCTGLILTGFGLKDSVKDIPESQFGEIFTYDMSISLSDDKNLKQVEDIAKNNRNIENYSKICASAGKLKGSEINYETTIFAIESIEDFEKVCNLKDVDKHEKIQLAEDGIILSDKVSEFLNVKQGDSIILIDSD